MAREQAGAPAGEGGVAPGRAVPAPREGAVGSAAGRTRPRRGAPAGVAGGSQSADLEVRAAFRGGEIDRIVRAAEDAAVTPAGVASEAARTRKAAGASESMVRAAEDAGVAPADAQVVYFDDPEVRAAFREGTIDSLVRAAEDAGVGPIGNPSEARTRKAAGVSESMVRAAEDAGVAPVDAQVVYSDDPEVRGMFRARRIDLLVSAAEDNRAA